jgi:RNA-directed DNA polymerase
LKPESVSTKQERIAKLAAANPAMAFTSLNHYCAFRAMTDTIPD